jgi:SAM-dependent methyltransferase
MNEMTMYSGGQHLEVMDDAVNYNAYLCNLVTTHALTNDRILDFGAGIGTFAIALRNKGHDISCVEPDLSQLLRITLKGIPGFSDLASAPAGFDYLFTLNVLEHIEDDQKTLFEFSQKIKPGGRLLIYVPAFQVLFSSMDRAVGHHRRYSRRDLTAKVKLAGFKIQQAQYVDSLGYIASLLYKYIGDKRGGLNRGAVLFFDRIVFPVSLILDYFTNKIFGKNLLVIAVRI